ncbi:MAG: class I SAM-dependent methyltransferase [Anaerolineales bacterium]|nr:class I SAM-dependent methyltransferase [Anaerolineales bacterium]
MTDHPEEMAEFFNQRSKGYDQHMEENVDGFSDFYHQVAKPLPETKQELRILDLGCGTGLELEGVFQRVPNAQITAVDLSPGMLAELERKNSSRLEQIELIQGSYLDLDLPEERFDFVISVMTLHHLLPETKLALYGRIYRTLKSGGSYIEGDYLVLEQKMLELRERYHQWLAYSPHSDPGEYHLDIPLTLSLQRELLKTAGFTDSQVIWQQDEAAVIVASKDSASGG